MQSFPQRLKRRGITRRPAKPKDFRLAWIILPRALMRYNNLQNMLEMPVDFSELWNPALKWAALLPGHNFENRMQEDSKWVRAKPSGSCEEHHLVCETEQQKWYNSSPFKEFLKYWSSPVQLMVLMFLHALKKNEKGSLEHSKFC